MPIPEEIAREHIDELLSAVREYPTDSGPSDCLLFVDRKPVGVIEAKPQGTTLSSVPDQSQRYLTSKLKYIKLDGIQLCFGYESTGVETFFRDVRDPKPCVTVVDVCIVRTGKQGVNNRWLMYAANSPQFRVIIAAEQSGSTRKRISRSNLAKLQVFLPPLHEQRRIVTKIEKLFTKLDAVVMLLKEIQKQLKRYRQSVLKSAFEGKLTAEWRERKFYEHVKEWRNGKSVLINDKEKTLVDCADDVERAGSIEELAKLHEYWLLPTLLESIRFTSQMSLSKL
jgi:restriction endonuclease S subunit